MKKRLVLKALADRFSLGPRSVGDFLAPDVPKLTSSVWLIEPEVRNLAGYNAGPINEFHTFDSDDLDFSSTGTVLKSLNLTLEHALETKALLEAASSLASAYRSSSHSDDLPFHVHWSEPQCGRSKIGSSFAPNAFITPGDASGSWIAPLQGPSSAGAFSGTHIQSLFSNILSFEDYSSIIAAYDSFIGGLAATVTKLHRYALVLLTRQLFLLTRIGKSVEGFIAFITWPRPPTSPLSHIRSLSA